VEDDEFGKVKEYGEYTEGNRTRFRFTYLYQQNYSVASVPHVLPSAKSLELYRI